MVYGLVSYIYGCYKGYDGGYKGYGDGGLYGYGDGGYKGYGARGYKGSAAGYSYMMVLVDTVDMIIVGGTYSKLGGRIYNERDQGTYRKGDGEGICGEVDEGTDRKNGDIKGDTKHIWWRITL